MIKRTNIFLKVVFLQESIYSVETAKSMTLSDDTIEVIYRSV